MQLIEHYVHCQIDGLQIGLNTVCMLRPILLVTMVKEKLTGRQIERVPEPDLIMDNPENVLAFRDAGLNDGPLSGAYVFTAAQVSRAISGCQKVIDLGCGPGRQLAMIAKLNPKTSFVGIDLSDEMLDEARQFLAQERIANVELVRADICNLKFLGKHSVDGVISTVALHHLPTLEHLRMCFREINRVLVSDGAICLTDLGRPKRLKSIYVLSRLHERFAHPAFIEDSIRSWQAAFLPRDFMALAHEELKLTVSVSQTAICPAFMVLKSEDRPISSEVEHQLKQLYRSLLPRNRKVFDELKTAFAMGPLESICKAR